jgi:hypothetical protein
VAAPTCGSGTTRLGRACVDRPSIPNWTIVDGNASWDMPGQWLTTYSWTVPQAVAATGAPLSLRASAEERTGRANTRICPALSARAGFTFKGGLAQPVVVGFCAEAIVKPTDAQSRALTLLPTSAAPGSLLYLTIGVQDGPSYTYVYRASAAPTKPKPEPKPKPKPKQCAAPTSVTRTSSGLTAFAQAACSYTLTLKFRATNAAEGIEYSGRAHLVGSDLDKLQARGHAGSSNAIEIRTKASSPFGKRAARFGIRFAKYVRKRGVLYAVLTIDVPRANPPPFLTSASFVVCASARCPYLDGSTHDGGPIVYGPFAAEDPLGSFPGRVAPYSGNGTVTMTLDVETP